MSAADTVVVAMSGGVDSSVAAALLLRQGYNVIGVFMRLGTPDGQESGEGSGFGVQGSVGSNDEIRNPKPESMTNDEVRMTKGQTAHVPSCLRASVPSCLPASKIKNQKSKIKNPQGCCSVLDATDARRVAAVLGIPLYVLNFQEDFGRIIDYFVAEYNQGRTPNPCVRCNDWLKFGRLVAYADAVGARYIATGHYARIATDERTGQRLLLRGRDARKDQSYVLFGMRRQVLQCTLLPIGELEKPAVRRMARELRLPVYNKPDSQEICFVPDQDYAALVRRRTPLAVREGDIVDTCGRVLGRHPGHQHFTVGQRRGTGVAAGHPLYVTRIDAAANRVVLGDRGAVQARTLTAGQVNWLCDRVQMAGGVMRCTAKIRYNHQPQPATVRLIDGGIRVEFDEPQLAITPGQAVVVYDGEVVLGGGWIDAAQ